MNGNDWSEEVIYNCIECGIDNVCDVCHDHDQPRGECDECPPELDTEKDHPPEFED